MLSTPRYDLPGISWNSILYFHLLSWAKLFSLFKRSGAVPSLLQYRETARTLLTLFTFDYNCFTLGTHTIQLDHFEVSDDLLGVHTISSVQSSKLSSGGWSFFNFFSLWATSESNCRCYHWHNCRISIVLLESQYLLWHQLLTVFYKSGRLNALTWRKHCSLHGWTYSRCGFNA